MEPVIELRYAVDTLYLLFSGALVMWMAAGFSMLESGLVRAKNTAEILTKNLSLYAVASVMYMLVGYNLMYPGDPINSFLPSLSFLLGSDNAPSDVIAAYGTEDEISYSAMADFFFQVVFVATAMSIVSGAVAERMRLFAFLIFAVVMTGFIYPIQGYWKWGGGFLDEMGFVDFAGSGVVHLAGAAAALAGVILLGARKGKFGPNGEIYALPGANMPLAALGGLILWLGWFGFNGGSELRISNVDEANIVAKVFVNTNMAAAGGLIAALLTARIWFGKADLTMAINGAIAGLVAITAAPDSPIPALATLIGAIGGILVVLAIIFLEKLHLDDPVGAISVHGVVGIWGLLAVPLSNDEASFLVQLIGVSVIFGWVFVTSFIVWLILRLTMGIRVSEEAEYEGTDIHECGLEAYPEFTRSPATSRHQ
jgi:Amt family ammonium transporter